MMRPLHISFRNMEPSSAVEEKIRDETEALERFYKRITSCSVTVELQHRRHDHGNLFHIHIDIAIPGGEITVMHEPGKHRSRVRSGIAELAKAFEPSTRHKSGLLAIHDAFDIARRQLQAFEDRRRGSVKVHDPASHAYVSRLFPKYDYGFLETADHDEVYFHRNSVLNDDFNLLHIGADVSYVAEEGEKGLQASTVRVTAK